MTELDREALERAISERGTTPRALSLSVGKNAYLVRDILSGKSQNPRSDSIAKIAEALDVSVRSLLKAGEIDKDGPHKRQPGPTTVPVVGYVQAGAEAVLFAAGQGPFDYVTAPQGSSDKTVAVEIRGESLGPMFSEWLVFYDDVRSPITSDLFGKLCVVGLPDERILVKQIKPSKSPGLYHLMSQTEGPIFDQDILWAAKVKSMSPR